MYANPRIGAFNCQPTSFNGSKRFHVFTFFYIKACALGSQQFWIFFFFLNSVILKKCGGKMGQKSHTEIDRQNLKMDLGRGF